MNTRATHKTDGSPVIGSVSLFVSTLLDAEEKCYKNKHNSIEAARVHYNLRIVADLAKELHNGTWEQGTAIVFGITYPTLREFFVTLNLNSTGRKDICSL